MTVNAAGKGDDPRPMTPEGKKRHDETHRRVFGTRVKIPPPGQARLDLISRLRRAFWDKASLPIAVRHLDMILDALEEELG